MSIIIMLIVGAVAGWLASKVVHGYDFGLLANMVIGVVGAALGGWLFTQLGIHPLSGLLGDILTAFTGAVVLLLLLQVVRRIIH